MKAFFILIFLGLFYHPASAQQQFVLHSDFLNKPDTIWVFTPQNAVTNQALPLVYLLHGWSGNYRQWDEMIDCQSYADKYGFVIVCPDGLYDSWYVNSPVDSENQYDSFFMQDLVPFIARNFKVQNGEIFITGLSMGGHGALYLFEKHASYFISAGSISGLLDLTTWRDHYGIARVLGLTGTSNDNDILRKYSVAGNIEQLKKAQKPIIVSCGTEDPFYDINVKFIADCKENNIDVTFFQSPGIHNSAYWSKAVIDHFEFFHQMSGKE